MAKKDDTKSQAAVEINAAPAALDPGPSKANETILEKAEDAVREVAGEVVEMVTVTVPKAFKLRIDQFRELTFGVGVQEMEKAHAEHWYSKANGVTIYEPKKPE